MLGSLIGTRKWQWAVRGKHPSVKDYFTLGEDFRLFRAFSDWMEKGYRGLPSRRPSSKDLLSWRFWAGGMEKDNILCGIIKDSSDSVGRPYPLLMAGTGPLKGWQSRWDRVPDACESVWNQMELISARMFRDLKQIEGELRGIRHPDPDWLGLSGNGSGAPEQAVACGKQGAEGAGGAGPADAGMSGMAAGAEVFVLPDEEKDYHEMICSCHSFLKARLSEAPKTVFVGGYTSRTYLASFRRPLTADDFVRLWSVGTPGQ